MVFLEGPPRTRRPKVPKITQEEHRVAPRPPQGLPHRVPRIVIIIVLIVSGLSCRRRASLSKKRCKGFKILVFYRVCGPGGAK